MNEERAMRGMAIGRQNCLLKTILPGGKSGRHRGMSSKTKHLKQKQVENNDGG
jgi:hypothetical protein